MGNPLNPSASLLCKMGSVLVHVEELTSPKGHIFDHQAFKTAYSDPEVQAWIEEMSKMGFLPVKR
jgi:hypothetical protein